MRRLAGSRQGRPLGSSADSIPASRVESPRNSLSNVLGLPGASCLGTRRAQASAHQPPGGSHGPELFASTPGGHWLPTVGGGSLGRVSGFRLNFAPLGLPSAEREEWPWPPDSGMQSISTTTKKEGPRPPLPALEDPDCLLKPQPWSDLRGTGGLGPEGRDPSSDYSGREEGPVLKKDSYPGVDGRMDGGEAGSELSPPCWERCGQLLLPVQAPHLPAQAPSHPSSLFPELSQSWPLFPDLICQMPHLRAPLAGPSL